MNDIVEFIKKRRQGFKNSCLSMEPLQDWIFWASAHGTLFYSKTNSDLFDSIGICWRIESKDHSNSTFQDFIDGFNPFLKDNYDVFVLDFFAENKEARNKLITNMTEANMELNNIWALRQGDTVKIPNEYILKLYKI